MRISAVADVPPAAVLDGINLFDPAFYATGDPHPVWAAMRQHAPLHRQLLPGGRSFWSVTRYDDVCRVLGNHREFTSERGSLLLQLGRPDAAAGRMLVATDPPRHSELRRPLAGRFTGRALAGTRERIMDRIRLMVAPALDGGTWDIAEQAAMLPMAVAAAIMELPAQDWPELVRWTGAAAAPTDPEYALGSQGATLAIAHHELFEYFAQQVRDREGTPGDDLIRHLMTMTAGEGRLTRDEVVVNCYSVLLGANATTPHTVAGTVQALAERPDVYRAVRDRPELVPALVEEGLRWTSAASSFLRYATAPAELSGGTVAEGDAVVVWIGSANRDEAVFRDPYRFDPSRGDNRHVAFGFGPHYCLGATVARLTLQLFFEEFVRVVEEVAPAGPVTHLVSNFVAGYNHLPVRTRLAGPAGARHGASSTAADR
jgi:cytochrome P450